MRDELPGSNIVVLDLETLASAEDCLACAQPQEVHDPVTMQCPFAQALASQDHYHPIGWDNKAALGLSIGCYWDYSTMTFAWFDRHTLLHTMGLLVVRQPLMVSFNGIGFDFALMRALIRREAETLRPDVAAARTALCDTFKALAAVSYDLLAAIWKVDPQGKHTRGLNSLDAISRANGFGSKPMDGVMAPRLWAQGHWAEVIAYNVGDVMKTRQLFELVCEQGAVLRGDGQPITLPLPRLN